MNRVVITGMGTVNPIGLTVQASWENCVNGVSAVGPITLFDASDHLVKIACEVKNFDPAKYLDVKEARRRDRYEQMATAAAKQALEQSGLQITDANADNVAVIVSSAIGGIAALQEAVNTLRDQGPRRVSPFLIPMLMPNGGAGLIGIDIGAKGPSFSITSACASGSDGIGTAWNLIRTGECEAAIAGASEATICAVAVAAFDRTGAMSRRNDPPYHTPQPFDKTRDGLVMGEGAAILILESEALARARRAEILAEVIGYAATADAYHVTAPAENGAGGAQAMRRAMKVAGINPEDVGYINAHGTGTTLNDASETAAIRSAFGERAHAIPVSSTKSMTGHMMGATGALEAIFCVQAIRTSTLPPTINYRTPDPACDLDVVPNTARQEKISIAMSNAFGFGGHNSVLVVREYQG